MFVQESVLGRVLVCTLKSRGRCSVYEAAEVVQADSDARLAMVALTWHNGDVEVAETCPIMAEIRIVCIVGAWSLSSFPGPIAGPIARQNGCAPLRASHWMACAVRWRSFEQSWTNH